MFEKKIYVIFLIVGLLVAGSTFTLLYFWADMQRKTPIRAKQVFYIDEVPSSFEYKPICQYKN